MKKRSLIGGKKKANRSGDGLIPVLILLVGLAVLTYPTISNWWNSMHSSQTIASYVASVDSISDNEKKALIDKAKDYNLALFEKRIVFAMTDEDIAEYESLLDVTGTGIMGHVQISSLGIDLPIYHGTNEAVLQEAIGHIEWTSLPVGGKNAHCVISGHRGLPRAKLFSDIDRLEIGDIFTLNILGDTLTYMVDQKKVVLPDETDDLMIVEGMDLCTLVTCTPYGINTHRLLIRGYRIDNIPLKNELTLGATKKSNLLVFSVVFIPIMFLFLSIWLIKDFFVTSDR